MKKNKNHKGLSCGFGQKKKAFTMIVRISFFWPWERFYEYKADSFCHHKLFGIAPLARYPDSAVCGIYSPPLQISCLYPTGSERSKQSPCRWKRRGNILNISAFTLRPKIMERCQREREIICLEAFSSSFGTHFSSEQREMMEWLIPKWSLWECHRLTLSRENKVIASSFLSLKNRRCS